jgi:hypothetical protein
VSKSTVENYRNSLSVQNGQINPERIATRNGKTYTINTANIGKRSEPEPAQADVDPNQRPGRQQSKENFSFDLQKDRSQQNGISKQRASENFSDARQSRATRNGVSRYTQRKLDRLARERPDLHTRVLNEELQPHARAFFRSYVYHTRN